MTYDFEISSGSAKLYWNEKEKEHIIAEASGNGIYSITLGKRDNYIAIHGAFHWLTPNNSKVNNRFTIHFFYKTKRVGITETPQLVRTAKKAPLVGKHENQNH